MANATRNAELDGARRWRFSGRKRHRVLIAEDDDALRQLMARTLADDGYEVDEAMSGFELLALLARPGGDYDVVVSDVRMPGLTGLEVIDELRSHPELRDANLPVILVTAFADRQTRAEAGRLQAILLEKPLDLDALRSNVADLADPTQLVS